MTSEADHLLRKGKMSERVMRFVTLTLERTQRLRKQERMNHSLGQQPKKTARAGSLFLAALALGYTLGTVTNALTHYAPYHFRSSHRRKEILHFCQARGWVLKVTFDGPRAQSIDMEGRYAVRLTDRRR